MGILSKIKDTISNIADGLDHYKIVKEDNKWKFQKYGADRSIKNFDVKEEALSFAKEYMTKHRGSLKIYKEDGILQEERTYPVEKETAG